METIFEAALMSRKNPAKPPRNGSTTSDNKLIRD
jgi:hypothetical protein